MTVLLPVPPRDQAQSGITDHPSPLRPDQPSLSKKFFSVFSKSGVDDVTGVCLLKLITSRSCVTHTFDMIYFLEMKIERDLGYIIL